MRAQDGVQGGVSSLIAGRAIQHEVEQGVPAMLPDLPHSPHPNCTTPQGLERLRRRLRGAEQRMADVPHTTDPLELARLPREVRGLQSRVASAIPIDAAVRGTARVSFGTTVTEADEAGRAWRYQIVGEDEADPEHGQVSWLLPLARALEGAQPGDVVVWKRPAGDMCVEVVAIETGQRSVQ
jgi:transcription elongation factor GreB